MTKIKICGLTNIADALHAYNCGADALGFIIEVPVNTPRNITRTIAREIIHELPPFAMTVGVIIPTDLSTAISIIDTTGVHVIQIHAEFESLNLKQLKEKGAVRVIRCYPIDNGVQSDKAITTIEEYIQNNVDAILLDSKGEKGAGGTGRIHDWTISANIRHSFDFPFILAGGITTENVERVIDIVDPYAVDVASGVESEPGIKDPKKISEIIQKVRDIS